MGSSAQLESGDEAKVANYTVILTEWQYPLVAKKIAQKKGGGGKRLMSDFGDLTDISIDIFWSMEMYYMY